MRWLFADPTNADEAAHLKRTVAAIDHWWQAFQAKAKDIDKMFRGKSEWNVPQFMEDTLQAIDPRLMWEFGGATRGKGHRLVITPESHRELRPLVGALLERAPKIDGWEFYAYRLAETAEQAIQAVKARLDIDISGATVEARTAPGRKIDLDFHFLDSLALDEESAGHAAFVVTEALMGEQVLDTWIGSIGVIEAGDAPTRRLLPLDRGQATVASMIRALIEQLPDVRSPDISMKEGWATVKLQPPDHAADYAGRTDLIFASTPNAELFQAAHSGQPFTSSCHSKLGELFCYLKIDAEPVPASGRVAFRSRFEDALNPALLAANAGCCTGGGSGLRYAYIDLAIVDLRKAAAIIRKVLTEQRAPLRSWLLFFDDDLAAEWFGAHGQTPPPPMPAAEEP